MGLCFPLTSLTTKVSPLRGLINFYANADMGDYFFPVEKNERVDI